MKSVIVIRHVQFEGLGLLEEVLAEQKSLQVRFFDAGVDDLGAVAPLEPALLVVLGGPGLFSSVQAILYARA